MFEITFSKDRIYQAGDVLEGRLLVNLNSTIHFEKIMLKIVGKSHVEWSVDSHTERKLSECLRKEIMIYSGPTLVEGKHSFDFRLTLPENLPSYFNDKFDDGFGSVYYYIKAKIIGQHHPMTEILMFPCSLAETVKNNIEFFVVNGKLDLNLNSNSRMEGKIKQLKMIHPLPPQKKI